MVDLVSQNQIEVLFKRLDPESQASVLCALINVMPDTHYGIEIDKELAKLEDAAGELDALISRCRELAHERYDPEASRADRIYDERREDNL